MRRGRDGTGTGQILNGFTVQFSYDTGSRGSFRCIIHKSKSSGTPRLACTPGWAGTTTHKQSNRTSPSSYVTRCWLCTADQSVTQPAKKSSSAGQYTRVRLHATLSWRGWRGGRRFTHATVHSSFATGVRTQHSVDVPSIWIQLAYGSQRRAIHVERDRFLVCAQCCNC